jgi:shikimate 5-dehydrogenase
MVYNPLETTLIRRAREQVNWLSGLSMFIDLTVRQFDLDRRERAAHLMESGVGVPGQAMKITRRRLGQAC